MSGGIRKPPRTSVLVLIWRSASALWASAEGRYMASPASVRSMARLISSSIRLRDRDRYAASHGRSRLCSMSPMNSRVRTISPRSRTSGSASPSLAGVCRRGACSVSVSVVSRDWSRCCCSSHFSAAVSSASSASSRVSSVVTAGAADSSVCVCGGQKRPQFDFRGFNLVAQVL